MLADLHLRPWRVSDAVHVLAAARGAPDLERQFAGIAVVDEASAGEYLDLLWRDEDTGRHLAVVADGVPVGDVGVTVIDGRHGTGWASYWLAARARGRGLATRALVTVSTLAFIDGVERIALGHRVDNPASCRVAERAGFRAEGIERGRLRYGAERFDVERHARLASDPDPGVEPITVVGLG